MDKINSELKAQAIAHGMCADWQGKWEYDMPCDELAELMYKGINFCLKHNWPECAFLTNNFSVDERRRNNIIANDTYSLLNPEKTLVLGKSECKIRFNGLTSGNVYLRDNANVIITAKNRSRVYVKVHGNVNLTASTEDVAKIVIVKCSPGSVIKTDGNVVVRISQQRED